MSEKSLELARKLQELARRGIGGEKINAERLLTKLMNETGISLDDLEKTKRNLEQFGCKAEHHFLLRQVAWCILGKNAAIYKDKRGKRSLLAECTPAEEIEIKATFEFFRNAYQAELEIFKSAFVQKNRIFSKDGNSVDVGSLSPEEKKRAFKVMLVAEGIDHHSLLRQIEEKNNETSGV